MSEVIRTFMLNYTLSSTSPMWNYGTTSNAENSSAWQANTSSVFFTSEPGASLQLPFHGTSISLYGSAGCPFNVTIDGQTTPQSPASGLLFNQNVDQGTHSLDLVVGPSAGPDTQFVFDYAVLSDPYSLEQALVEIDCNVQNDTLIYSPNWSIILNGTAHTESPGASVSLNFTGVAVAVTGPSGTELSPGNFTVILDGLPWTLSNNTAEVSETQLFYQSGLDVTRQHAITLVNGGSGFAFTSITIWQIDEDTTTSDTTSDTSGSRTNTVKIIAPIVAIVGAILLLAVALWVRRQRNLRRRSIALSGPFGMRLARTFRNTEDVKKVDSEHVEAMKAGES
ncbi:hypothetical protein OBBRIDRAFT_837568 [Obba rivulosa]|uniref:Uncharacterized protein n=1 Tax=Obba rivulosa TaxID=1052685 RepID=A0A8E2DHQ1_9APHY|nr:hypothetical protein OBBRIDRAFT_837568 [Obba rivulosa]